MMNWRRRKPEEPTDVGVLLSDGTFIPCHLTYLGRRRRRYIWRAVPSEPIRDLSVCKIGILPGRTYVEFELGAMETSE